MRDNERDKLLYSSPNYQSAEQKKEKKEQLSISQSVNNKQLCRYTKEKNFVFRNYYIIYLFYHIVLFSIKRRKYSLHTCINIIFEEKKHSLKSLHTRRGFKQTVRFTMCTKVHKGSPPSEMESKFSILEGDISLNESFHNMMNNKIDIMMKKEDPEPQQQQQPDNQEQYEQLNSDPIPSPETTEHGCPCCYPQTLAASSKHMEQQQEQRRSFLPPLPWHHNNYTTQHHHHHHHRHEGVSRWPFTSVAMSHKDSPPHSLTAFKKHYDIPVSSRRTGGGCYIRHPYLSPYGNSSFFNFTFETTEKSEVRYFAKI